MILNTKVYTNTKFNKIIKIDDILKIYMTEKAIKGKANNKAIELLSDYFKVSKSKINLIKGTLSQNKVFEILK